MEVAILQTEDKSDLRLLAEIARKVGIQFKVLSEEEKEDIGMTTLMRQADRSQHANRKEIMEKLGRHQA